MKLLKTIPGILALMSLSLTGNAQFLDNADLENWTQADSNWAGGYFYALDNWSTYSYGYHELQRTTDSYSGTYAAVITPMMSCGIMPGMMFYGEFNPYGNDYWNQNPTFNGSGSPIDFKPSKLKGYYKLPDIGSTNVWDSAYVRLILKKYNNVTQQSEIVGEGTLKFPYAEEYTYFEVPVNDLMPGVTPDSIMLAFVTNSQYHFDSLGMHLSELYIDQLRLTRNPTVSIEEENNMQMQVYPNPTHDFVNILFESDISDPHTLSFMDMNGRVVLQQSILPNQTQQVNISPLSAGKYIATIASSNGNVAQTSIVVDGCFY